MRFSQLSYAAALAGSQLVAAADEVHGQGLEGTVMGPVAFLWPADRPWSASADNSGPCGSASGVTNRTIFPLSQGTVSLSIADEAWNVNFSMAYDNTPTIQSQFSQQVVSEVTEIEPGHQCYKVANIPSSVTAGSNATIQLAYWSNVDNELGGANQTFYACADITFVETKDFNIAAPCFNVTASDFNSGSSSSTSSPVPNATGASETTSNQSSSSDGLSTGAKAGVAVGVIVASLGIVGAIAFILLRKRRSAPHDSEASVPAKNQPEVASVNSHRN
ncbi:uncharacterized protein GGS22DRAFT_149303 [Annulohypoxylon maeteangense]|uniref:uncharacterized protein n=1 Tax=Annulohypoxylon maeteangense TaxID=1927788 RepID=UPI00200865CE|nr:uncharacterized protein GGS22DRAFT_149303 [Annulohypoxylon maeteangense]KAI0889853.1 hypothetical protein GGS22DRAFT_149303 [Annulohypoxylon maeteangense]